MGIPTGATLLHAVSERILLRFLHRSGYGDVRRTSSELNSGAGAGVDIVYGSRGKFVTVKIKADPYFGTDPSKIRDRSLVYYRSDAKHYAFEAISNNLTREPGWMLSSDADLLYYYFIALDHTEEEVAALYSDSDEVFFSELRVERDELRILPLQKLRNWFESNFESYTPRPVVVGEHSAWFRLIPLAEIDSAVPDTNVIFPIFSQL